MIHCYFYTHETFRSNIPTITRFNPPPTYILVILLLCIDIIMNDYNNVSWSPFTSPTYISLFPYTRIGFSHLHVIYVQPSSRRYDVCDSFIIGTSASLSLSHTQKYIPNHTVVRNGSERREDSGL